MLLDGGPFTGVIHGELISCLESCQTKTQLSEPLLLNNMKRTFYIQMLLYNDCFIRSLMKVYLDGGRGELLIIYSSRVGAH